MAYRPSRRARRNAALSRLAQGGGQRLAYLAQGVYDLVAGDAALNARHRHIRACDRIDSAYDVPLDPGCRGRARPRAGRGRAGAGGAAYPRSRAP